MTHVTVCPLDPPLPITSITVHNYHPNNLLGAAILVEIALSQCRVCFLDSPRSPLSERPFRVEFTMRGEYLGTSECDLQTHP